MMNSLSPVDETRAADLSIMSIRENACNESNVTDEKKLSRYVINKLTGKKTKTS